MAFLSLVFWSGFQVAQFRTFERCALSGPVQILRWQSHALHALLSVVSAKSAAAVAGSAISATLQPMWVVGRFGFLELLSLVQTRLEALIAR